MKFIYLKLVQKWVSHGARLQLTFNLTLYLTIPHLIRQTLSYQLYYLKRGVKVLEGQSNSQIKEKLTTPWLKNHCQCFKILRYKSMWCDCNEITLQVNHYKSKYCFQHRFLAHTEQQVMKGPKNY